MSNNKPYTPKANNAMAILRKNLGYQDMLDLIELLQSEVEKISQDFMKEDLGVE
jgi:hypothetical protein